jgi:large conductance mechanosensitive channel
MLNEFREFINRGSVIDLSVAVVMGAAFNAIIASIVDDLIMPLVGILIGGVDFSSLAIEVGDATLTYGNLIQATINFLIIALVMFLIVKAYNDLQKTKEDAPADPTRQDCPFCCTEIPIKASRCPNCTSELAQTASTV